MSTIIVIAANPSQRRAIVQATTSAMPHWRVENAAHPGLLVNRPPDREYALMLLAVPNLEDIHQIVVMAQLAYRPKAILLLTHQPTQAPWAQGLPTGVVGCVPDNASPDMLQSAIKLVLAGGMLFPSQIVVTPPLETALPVAAARDGQGARATDAVNLRESAALGLTPRQYEVLVLLARGHSLKEIGRQLNIAMTTAKVHAETVYQRLHVHSRTEAVYAAISRGATLGWSTMTGESAVEI